MNLVRNSSLCLLLLLTPSLVLAQAQQEARVSEAAQESEQVIAKLQAAAVRDETIALFIQEGKFGAIVPEFKRIFDLDLPRDYEKYQVQAVFNAVRKLNEKRQFIVGHNIVDLALENLQNDDSKFKLYVIKSSLFLNSGQTREAAEAIEAAKKFQKQEKDRRK